MILQSFASAVSMMLESFASAGSGILQCFASQMFNNTEEFRLRSVNDTFASAVYRWLPQKGQQYWRGLPQPGQRHCRLCFSRDNDTAIVSALSVIPKSFASAVWPMPQSHTSLSFTVVRLGSGVAMKFESACEGQTVKNHVDSKPAKSPWDKNQGPWGRNNVSIYP